jgi:hypothetical protein
MAGQSLRLILLTSLKHVNWPEGKISLRRIQIEPGAFSGKVEAGLPLENAPL